VVTADTTSGAVTLTLPAASGCTGKAIRIIKVAGANTLTVTRAGSDTITPSSGTRTSVAFPSDCAMGEIVVVSSGTSWHVVSGQASDESVGSRLYKWSQAVASGSTTAAVGWQLVRYDTGWRNVTADLDAGVASGTVLIRRTNATAEARFNLTWAVTQTTAGAVPLTLAVGFRPAHNDYNRCQLFTFGGRGSVAAYAAANCLLQSNGGLIVYATTSGVNVAGMHNWIPADALPSTLPGSAA
jgi:hypothetical protein